VAEFEVVGGADDAAVHQRAGEPQLQTGTVDMERRGSAAAKNERGSEQVEARARLQSACVHGRRGHRDDAETRVGTPGATATRAFTSKPSATKKKDDDERANASSPGAGCLRANGAAGRGGTRSAAAANSVGGTEKSKRSSANGGQTAQCWTKSSGRWQLQRHHRRRQLKQRAEQQRNKKQQTLTISPPTSGDLALISPTSVLRWERNNTTTSYALGPWRLNETRTFEPQIKFEQ
jgi:hypothetical protein